MKFNSVQELLSYLEANDLYSLDSEYSFRTKLLIEKFGTRGADLNSWWIFTPHDWECPACLRKKENIVRSNKHNYLMGHLHAHHDHMEEKIKERFAEISEARDHVVADINAENFAKRTASAITAFDKTVICSDCNTADTTAKKLIGCPQAFSFSPAEIASFILPKPNVSHHVDQTKAHSVWREAEPIFMTRLNFIDQFATLAANNDYWCQKSVITAEQIAYKAKSQLKTYGLDKLRPGHPESLLYQTNKFECDDDSWRQKHRKKEPMPTEGQVNHMAAVNGYHWAKIPHDWTCSVCSREKRECIRKSNKGEWSFKVGIDKLFFDPLSHEYYKRVTISLLQYEMSLKDGKVFPL